MTNKKPPLTNAAATEQAELWNHVWGNIQLLKIDQKKIDALRVAFDASGLPEPAWVTVLNATVRVTDFARSKKKTPAEKWKSMDRIRTAARELGRAIDDIEFGEYLKFDHELLRGGCTREYPKFDALFADLAPDKVHESSDITKHATVLSAVADAVEKAASTVLPTITKTGRTRVLGGYASNIAWISCQLKPFNMKPYVGGKFHALCDAIFEASGTGSKAEGAIREFEKTMRKSQQENGYCL